MNWQRTIGIDLALEGKHAAVCCDQGGKVINSKPFLFTTDLKEMEELINKYIPEGINKKEIAIVMEPTGNAWLIVSSYFISRGFSVFVVKTQKSYDLRKYFKKHAKTDRIDATALAKMPFVDSESLNLLVLSDKDYFALGKIIKFRDDIVGQVSAYKAKIYAHFQLLNPKLMALFGEDRFNKMARAFYRKYANPFKVKEDGLTKFTKYLNKEAFGTPDQEKLKNMFDASVNMANFHQDILLRSNKKDLPYDLDAVQEIINDELEIIEYLEKKEAKVEKEISRLYDKIDPQKILKGIKGFGGNLIAPAIIAFTGSVKRFGNLKNYLGYIGLVPKAKQSVKPPKEGMKITKTGQRLLKKYYCLAAEVARRFDVEFAHKYKILIDKGLHHNQAICALANMLARRVYSLLKRKEEAIEKNDMIKLNSIKYNLYDLEHKEITESEAREICRKDYPGKKEQARRQQKEKEKAALALSPGQSPSKNLKVTPLNIFRQPPPVINDESILS